MSHWARHFSAEAISSALAPKTQTWYREEGRKIPAEDAAMALAGVESVARAFLLVSWGHDSPEDVSACTRFLCGAGAWEADAENWPNGRLERLVEMAIEEIRHAEPVSEAERARKAGMGEWNWHQRWKTRYRRILGDALEQVSRAHEGMARRVSS